MSPWLTPYGVDKELLTAISTATERKIKVWIGYGYDTYPSKEERYIVKELESIKNRYKNLYLCRITGTHAKIVICDQKFMVVTSFNWLSFHGGIEWNNREEFGVLIETDKNDDGHPIIEAMEKRLRLLSQFAGIDFPD